MTSKTLLTLLLTFGLFIAKPSALHAKHPFYISVTEMKYVGKTKLLEISCKMFAEDIQDALKFNYRTMVDLSNDKLQAQNNKMISEYIQNHFALNIDGKPTAIKFVGFEKESESIYCYFEVANLQQPTKVIATNSILRDFKKEQINIMHFIVNGNRKSTKVDYPATQATFNF